MSKGHEAIIQPRVLVRQQIIQNSWIQDGAWPQWEKMLERGRGQFLEGSISHCARKLHSPMEVGLWVLGICLHLWISNLFNYHIQSEVHWSMSFHSHKMICVNCNKGMELRRGCSAIFISYTMTWEKFAFLLLCNINLCKRLVGIHFQYAKWESLSCNWRSSLHQLSWQK